MATVGDVVRAAYDEIDEEANPMQGVRWFNARFAELAAAGHLRWLRRLGEFTIPAAISAGTVTATQGSAVVTPDADALAAWTADTPQRFVGRWMQLGLVWYRVASVAMDGSELQLSSPVAEDLLDASGLGYHLVERTPTLILPEKVTPIRRIHTIFFPRRMLMLGVRPYEELSAGAPERPFLDTGPEIVAQLGTSDDGLPQLECYPYSSQDELAFFTYFLAPPTFTWEDELPAFLDEWVMTAGLSVNTWGLMAARAFRAGRANDAGTALNQQARLRTVWGDAITAALSQDKGVTDEELFFALTRPGGTAAGVRDIRTAYEEWHVRGGSL